jgi:hypothetical protein
MNVAGDVVDFGVYVDDERNHERDLDLPTWYGSEVACNECVMRGGRDVDLSRDIVG